jgi:iron complex transport system permease protein
MSGYWVLGVLAVLASLLFVADVMMGSAYIPPRAVLSILWGENTDNETWNTIVGMIRLPKAITALLAGAGLSTCGLLMQTLFRNPLAGPSVLGITSGATLGVAAVILLQGGSTGIFLARNLGTGSSWMLIIASVAGAALVMALILLISVRIRDNVSLLIIGIMIGNLTVAVVSVWQYFSNPEQIQDYLLWTFGSLGGVTRDQISYLAPTVLAGLGLSIFMIKPLNTLLLGERYARSMGMNILVARFAVILISGLITGAVTAFCGPIAFIGIAVPHLVRALANTSDHRLILPATMLGGAATMAVCDILTQLPGTYITLPISAITAMIGSPIVIWIILKQKNLRRAY